MKRSLLVGLVAFVVLAGLLLAYFNRGIYLPGDTQPFSYESIAVPPGLAISEFTDTPKRTEGRIVFDLDHKNDFTPADVSVLSGRLASRGLSVEFLDKGSSSSSTAKDAQLKDKLKNAKAMIIITPRQAYAQDDLDAIREFVKGGGKLLLVADPTRQSEINRVSVLYDLVFANDYLYDQKENEGNYRNIIVSDFKDNKITKDIKSIALFTAGSIVSNELGIASTGANTYSSLIRSQTRFSPIALAGASTVLGIADLTFMTEPYNSVLDNNRLISNIADWLAGN